MARCHFLDTGWSFNLHCLIYAYYATWSWKLAVSGGASLNTGLIVVTTELVLVKGPGQVYNLNWLQWERPHVL